MGGVRKVITTNIGTAYTLTLNIDMGTAEGLYIMPRTTNGGNIYTGTNLAQVYVTTSGTHTVTFTASTSTTQLLVEKAGTVTQTFYIDNVKVEQSTPTLTSYPIADVVSAQHYYPFGSTMQTWEADGKEYVFGFNGKEKDNEDGIIQYDYGFRIYDPRIGRFKSVDPLAKSFAMLSTYQFTANSPIAATDLDGLEFYYTADGRLFNHKTAWIANNKLIPTKISDQIRVIHNLKTAGKYSTFNYIMFHQANEETRNRILTEIYQKHIGGKLPPALTTKNDGNDGQAGATDVNRMWLNIDASHNVNGEYLHDNLYNLINTAYHESLHFNGQSDDAFSHYKIIVAQVNHESWKRTTENYKDYTKDVAMGYINQMESFSTGLGTFVDGSPDRKQVFKTKNDEYSFNQYYNQYVDAIKHYNKTFNENLEIKSKESFYWKFDKPVEKRN
jgi:RHS repeat-associated protein